MTSVFNHRRPWILAGLLLFVPLLGIVAMRLTLVAAAVNRVLHSAGATEVAFNVTRAAPWQVVVEDLDLQIDTLPISAERVSVDRPRWWAPSLGRIRVEQATMPVAIDTSERESSPGFAEHFAVASAALTRIPAEEISIDGRLVIAADGLGTAPLNVAFDARPEANDWSVQVEVTGEGLAVQSEARVDPATGSLIFEVPEFSIELEPWQEFVWGFGFMPDGVWEMQGNMTGRADGRLDDAGLITRATVQLRAGRVTEGGRELAVTGIEADLEFTDVGGFVTSPGSIRIHELRAGKLSVSDVQAELALDGPDRILVNALSLSALGGRVDAEPFEYEPQGNDFEATVNLAGIAVEEIMALTQDLPAHATGRVDGRLPIRYDDEGVHFGQGWLELQPGAPAEVQFNSEGLLTAGTAETSRSYAVLQKIESGLLNLKLTSLRLDIQPPNAPPGRSAQLHLTGEPVDPTIKAPVILDLNVNGPLEKLLNLGLDSRVGFGSGP